MSEGFPGGSVVKTPPANAGDTGSIPEWGRSSEKEMVTSSGILAWEIPWTEEPGGLPSTGLQRAGHDNLVTKQQQLQPMPEGLFSRGFLSPQLPCELPSVVPVLCAPLTGTAQGPSLALKPGWRLLSWCSQKSGLYQSQSH